MKHKGKIVEKVVRESGISITKICKKLGKTTRWMYYTFENPDVSLDHIVKIIHHDFSGELNEYTTFFEKKPTSDNFNVPVTFFAMEKMRTIGKTNTLNCLKNTIPCLPKK
jgi:hypothetical protein